MLEWLNLATLIRILCADVTNTSYIFKSLKMFNWYCVWLLILSSSIPASNGKFCSFDSCYGSNGQAKPCIPAPLTVSARKNVTITNTCGEKQSEKFCEMSGLYCSYCDAKNGSLKHPSDYLVDGLYSTWWQSQTWWDTNVLGLTTMKNPLQVNITLSFGTSYLISGHIEVTFYNERPRGMRMERSIDNGHSWIPLQYFAKRCDSFYNMPTENSINTANPFKVQCTEKYSTQTPRQYGRVKYDGGSRYQVCNFMSTEVQAGLIATNIRIVLEYPATDGLEMHGRENHMRKYYYAISEIDITGRCDCNGHAKECQGTGTDTKCSCEHQTMGRNCEQCQPLFNNQPWKQANTTHGNECHECHCNKHGSSCVYNSTLGYGLCKGCRNNTEGDHCEKCVDKFFRNMSTPLDHPGACIACDCFPDGITNNGSCLQNATSIHQIGQCSCKPNVFGRKCNLCKPGHWGFTLPPTGECRDCNCSLVGTVNGSKICHQTTGQCQCKGSIQGQYCEECKDEYYRYPQTQAEGCRRCPCDLGGAYPGCNKQTGSCHCRHGVEGHLCTVPSPGRFYPALDYLVFEGETADGYFDVVSPANGMGSAFTGRGYAQLSPGQYVHFRDIKTTLTHLYSVAIRYSSSGSCTLGNVKTEVIGSNVNYSLIMRVGDINPGVGHGSVHPRLIPFTAGREYNVTVTYQGPGDCKLQVDSLVLVPNFNKTRVYTMTDPLYQDTLNQCLTTRAALSTINTETKICSRLVFSASTEIYNGTLECDCDSTGSINASQCIPYGGQCYCKPGVGGRRCNHCLPGFHSFSSSGCTRCGCSSAGSVSSVCNVKTGICKCKREVVGSKCNYCKPNYFNVAVSNPLGCQSCFGFGHASGCTSATGFVQAQVTTNFGGDLKGWTVTDKLENILRSMPKDSLLLDSSHSEVFLVAPQQYLSNKLTSYKQNLQLHGEMNLSALTSFEAILTGKDYNVTLPLKPTSSGSMTSFSVFLDEQHVTSPTNMTSFQFQSVLAMLKVLKIRLVFKPTLNGTVSIKNVSLTYAVRDKSAAESEHVKYVENATCHQNYTGLSCEGCAPGYKREIPFSNSFGRCVLCSCSGRSAECDSQSGNCTNCTVGTFGDRCQYCKNNVLEPNCTSCKPAYWGLSQSGCKECSCHVLGTWYGNSTVCDKVMGQCPCNTTMNVSGRRCDRCKENAYNASAGVSDCRECSSCYAFLQTDVHQLRPQVTQVHSQATGVAQHSVMNHAKTFDTRLKEAHLKVRQLHDKAVAGAHNDSTFKALWRNLQEELVTLETMVYGNLSSAVNMSSELGSQIQANHHAINASITQIVTMVRNGYRLLTISITKQLMVGGQHLEVLDDIDKELVTLSSFASRLLNSTLHANTTLQSGTEHAVRKANRAGQAARTVEQNYQEFLPYLHPLLELATSTKDLADRANHLGKQRLHRGFDILNDTRELQQKAATPNPDNRGTVQELAAHSRDVVTTSNQYVNQSINLWVSSTSVMSDVYLAIDRARGLVAVCAVIEQNTTAQRSSAELAHGIASNATLSARKTHQQALYMKEVLKDFETLSEAVELRANQSLDKIGGIKDDLNQVLTNTTHVNSSIYEAIVNSKRSVDLATNTKELAEDELKALTKALDRAQRLRHETKEKEDYIVNQTVRNYIKQEIEPVQILCQNLSHAAKEVSRKSEESLAQANETHVKGQRIIDQVSQAATEVSTLNVSSSGSSLANLKAAFQVVNQKITALNLRSDISELKAKLRDHQGKYEEQKRRKANLKLEIERVKNLIKSYPAVYREC